MTILGVMLITTGRKIKELRERKGWTRAQLAVRIGLSESAIARVELDNRKNPDTLRKIARALGVSEEKLLGASIEMPRRKKAS